MSNTIEQGSDYIIHGMFCSYFTKKLEAYFLAKGISYRFVEMDGAGLVHLGDKVGVAQLPHVECADGTWLTDTTPIIEHFESDESLIRLRPQHPLTAFCSYFLEDCFDEWFWAPAMYYRWAFKMDCDRRSEEFAYTILSNSIDLPRWLHKWVVIWRQRGVHLKGSGITTPAHARQVEDRYIDTLDLLQPLFEKRPYLFGERPCEADFGLFGPMFPHFGCDPTPQEIMHTRAPQVFRWLGTVWNTRLEQLQQAPELAEVPDDIAPLLQKLAAEYLPYLAVNQTAFQSGNARTQYRLGDVEWEVATAPYRVYCLTQLQQRFQALPDADRQRASELFGKTATEILAQPVHCPAEMANVTASQPIKSSDGKALGRLWQSKSHPFERWGDNMIRRKTPQSKPESKGVGSGWLPIYFQRFRAQ